MTLLRRTIWTLSLLSMLSLPVFLTGCPSSNQSSEPSATSTEEPTGTESPQAEPSGGEEGGSEAGSTTGGGTETP